MGQYFRLLNVDKKEKVGLPGGMKLLERVTNPVAMGMTGYLLFEGPLDGTCLTYRQSPEDPRLKEGIEERKEHEKEREEERYEQYVTGERNYAISKFRREHDAEPTEEREAFEAFCRKQARSIFRNDDGTWNYEDLAKVVASGFELDELTEYCGRWAGDDVRLVGDYAENDLYSESRTMWRYEYEGEEFVAPSTASAPVVPESIHRDDIEYSTENRDPEEGDLAYIRHPDEDERVFAHYMGEAETEWTDITEGLTEEFVELVGEDWVEAVSEHTMMRPDAVITA